jgi:hypothetical protein
LIIVGAIITLVTLLNARFRLVGSSPKGSAFPTSSNEIAFMFNKELDVSKLTKDSVTVDPLNSFTISVNQKTLSITFTGTPATDFLVAIKNITATNGETIAELKKSFKVEYVAYKNLTDYEQQRQINETDPIAYYVSIYPIISQLPIRTSEYTITHRLPVGYSSASDKPTPLVLDVAILVDFNNYDDVANIMQRVNEDLISRGFNPDDYYITNGLEAPL